MIFYYIKVQTRSCLPDMFLPLIGPFKWGIAWSSISRGIGYTSSQTFDHPSLLNKVGLFCNFWLWLAVILMPLEIKLHAIPHFKGLINGQSISGWHEWGFALHYQKPIWKVPILLHTEQTLYLLSVSSVIAQIRRWHLTNFYALSTAVLFVFW